MKRKVLVMAITLLLSAVCYGQAQLTTDSFKREILNGTSLIKPPLNSSEMKITNNRVKNITRWIYGGKLPRHKGDMESCIYGWFPVGGYHVFYYNEMFDIQDDMTSDFHEYLAAFDSAGNLKDTLLIYKTFNRNYSIFCKSFYLLANGHVLVMTLYDTPEVERIRNIVKPKSYYAKLPKEQAKKERAADFQLQSKLEQGKSDNPKTRYEIVEYALNTQTGKFESIRLVEKGFLDNYKTSYTSFDKDSPLYKFKQR